MEKHMRTIIVAVAVLLSAGLCLAEAPKPAPATQPAENAKPGKPSKIGDILKNSLGMKLTYIPAGDFVMGSPETEANRGDDEGQHKVVFTQPILMATTAVTQKQWRAIMGISQGEQRDEADPSSKLRGEGDDYPIYFVSWDDAVDFCRKLSQKERREYRLPTEAEWEYACRAGTTTPFNTGETITSDQANYNGNFVYGIGAKGENRDQTVTVGMFKPNAWGLYSMHGNVSTWCSDWYGDYPKADVTDPQGAGSGEGRVVRGGSWFGEPTACRSAARYKKPPEGRFNFIGLRVVTPVNAAPVKSAE
jgi:formylglycine-generating enzyme required for sulfatase activity